MRTTMQRLLCLFMFLFLIFQLRAEEAEKKRFTLSGYVRDASNGEALIGATVVVAGGSMGTAANA